MIPANPHAIIEITSPDGKSVEHVFDSWESKGLIESVGVDLTADQSAMAEWRFFDPNFRIIDAFAPKMLAAADAEKALFMVRIYLGYGRNLGKPIFKGLLAHIERDDSSTVFVAFDMGFTMKRVKRPGYHNKKDDLGVLKGLAERNNLKFSPPASALKLEPHNGTTQDEQTDWEHIMERARDAGLHIFVREDTLFARYPPKTAQTAKMIFTNRKDFTLKHGFDFIFRVPESQEGKKKVEVRGRGKRGKRLTGTSDENNRGKETVLLRRDVPGKHTKQKLTARAKAQKALEKEHAFEGSLKAIFPPSGKRLDFADTVEIQGIGKLHSGKYLCETVRYEFGAGQLEVSLDLYRGVKE